MSTTHEVITISDDEADEQNNNYYHNTNNSNQQTTHLLHDSNNNNEPIAYPIFNPSIKSIHRIQINDLNVNTIIEDINKTFENIKDTEDNLLAAKLLLGEKIYNIKKWAISTGKTWCKYCEDKFPKDQNDFYSESQLNNYIDFFKYKSVVDEYCSNHNEENPKNMTNYIKRWQEIKKLNNNTNNSNDPIIIHDFNSDEQIKFKQLVNDVYINAEKKTLDELNPTVKELNALISSKCSSSSSPPNPIAEQIHKYFPSWGLSKAPKKEKIVSAVSNTGRKMHNITIDKKYRTMDGKICIYNNKLLNKNLSLDIQQMKRESEIFNIHFYKIFNERHLKPNNIKVKSENTCDDCYDVVNNHALPSIYCLGNKHVIHFVCHVFVNNRIECGLCVDILNKNSEGFLKIVNEGTFKKLISRKMILIFELHNKLFGINYRDCIERASLI